MLNAALKYLPAALAFLAGALCLVSVFLPLPKEIRHIDLGWFDPSAPKPGDDLDRLTAGLARQRGLVGAAAVAAILSAVLQLVLVSLGAA